MSLHDLAVLNDTSLGDSRTTGPFSKLEAGAGIEKKSVLNYGGVGKGGSTVFLVQLKDFVRHTSTVVPIDVWYL